ncbi:unnamed protein product [Penicillium bialowiezense]
MNISISRFALVAGLLLGHASAGIPAASSLPASSQAHVMTATFHDRHPVVVLTTTLDTITVTPAQSTQVVTDYETSTVTSTAFTVTDTFSTTSTFYETSTYSRQDSPSTATVFLAVSTTSTTTSTIPTSSGFLPIADTIPSTPTVYKRSLQEEKEPECVPWVDDYQYAQEVVCYEKNVITMTTTSTVTGSPVTITAATPITTVTVTDTITSRSVVVPTDVSTTLSYSTTKTLTETVEVLASTTTLTSTTTVVGAVATATSYAACAANNIAGNPLSADFGSVEGKYMYYVTFANIAGEKLTVGNTASVYDCCVSCQESATCAMSYYWHSSAVTYCYLISTSQCSATDTYATVALHDAASNIQMSNGNCGHVVSEVLP